MNVTLRAPLLPLQSETAMGASVSLGVYIVRNQDEVIRIGYAGARSRFGLRSELVDCLARFERDRLNLEALRFQIEVNMQYWARWRELLIRYYQENSSLPPQNDAEDLDGVFARRRLVK